MFSYSKSEWEKAVNDRMNAGPRTINYAKKEKDRAHKKRVKAQKIHARKKGGG